VSGVHRYQYPAGTLLEYADCIQTDASINPGNSGGPLFNADGDLIGINGRGSFEKRGRVNVGVGYAISINQIKNFMGYLRSGRVVDHATLGATVSTDDEGRVIVANILESSDAYRRGMRYGDEILSFGGRSISSANEFKNVLGIFPRRWRIPISFRHDGTRHDVLVRLAGVHSREELVAKVQPNIPVPSPDKPRDENKKEKKDDGKPDPKKSEEKPRKPIPIKLPHGMPKPKVPEEVAKLIKARRGYANYYFNELNRQRIWGAFLAAGDYSMVTGQWTLRGELVEGGQVEIVLNNENPTARFPAGQARLEPGKDLDQQLGPEGSGGLLAALYLWKRMLTVGPAQFGDVYYLGTVPVPNQSELCDVLVGTHDVTETHFIFAPDTGYLVAVEMYSASNMDPCEIYFDDFRNVEGRMIPHRMEVRYGNDIFADVRWSEFKMEEAAIPEI
jgi:hypothetical protein